MKRKTKKIIALSILAALLTLQFAPINSVAKSNKTSVYVLTKIATKNSKACSKFSYDKSGMIKSVKSYDWQNKLWRTMNYNYDKYSKLTSSTNSYAGSGKTTYKYDKKNRLIQDKLVWHSDDAKTTITYVNKYTYNKSNKISKIAVSYQYGKNKGNSTMTLSYNKSGYVKTITDTEGKEKFVNKLSYDKYNNLIKLDSYKIKNTYNSKKLLVKQNNEVLTYKKISVPKNLANKIKKQQWVYKNCYNNFPQQSPIDLANSNYILP
ncbi:YD repeat-containing protein [Acetitomaculum ruminis DSM 5522]|uniref:YD repeat-containing protein n=1 Tax=Acetitomaculum ruminis DSM 5522 TaxID=1120918 RepID=A0A1I1AKC7_9FIRM|nr:hypothetical protein [Acetitomaculum ruminis]SFB38474.1 YD repeat-containing protein [Acetitomaculum ruminis DSM 5522]